MVFLRLVNFSHSLAFQIWIGSAFHDCRIHQGMDAFISDAIIFATWVWTKVSMGGYFLMTAATFPQPPGRGHSGLENPCLPFSSTQNGQSRSLSVHQARVTGLCCAFLFLEEAQDPSPANDGRVQNIE